MSNYSILIFRDFITRYFIRFKITLNNAVNLYQNFLWIDQNHTLSYNDWFQ